VLDLKVIRSDPERVEANLARRGAAGPVAEVLALDERARELESTQFSRRVESCGCWTVVDGWFTRVHHCDQHRRVAFGTSVRTAEAQP